MDKFPVAYGALELVFIDRSVSGERGDQSNVHSASFAEI